jgi:lipopolysaccharide transport system ATP-binding protein
LSDAEMVKRMDGIVDFSGIQDFIDQPVRSYSSGMFVRLAFSMATSVDPDILVVDEALSVGDGAFARKSYERIMALKDQGVTILFCSHSMFQVEQLCTRALWIESGELRFDGFAHQATVAYSEWLARFEQGQSDLPAQVERFETEAAAITRVQIRPTADGQPFMNRRDALWLDIALRTDPKLPSPTLGVVVCGADARPITSAGSWIDGAPLQRLPDGSATATLVLPEMPLLKGRYTVSVYVLCERALHLNAAAEHAVAFEVTQAHVEQGVVSVPHQWVMESAR